jgi:hypothetical protein
VSGIDNGQLVLKTPSPGYAGVAELLSQTQFNSRLGAFAMVQISV